jgi:predicted nuclease with TOPRIM domain
MENGQLKEQLGRRVQEGNRLFEELNRAEGEVKEGRMQLGVLEGALRNKEEEVRAAQGEAGAWQGRAEKAQGERRAL